MSISVTDAAPGANKYPKREALTLGFGPHLGRLLLSHRSGIETDRPGTRDRRSCGARGIVSLRPQGDI